MANTIIILGGIKMKMTKNKILNKILSTMLVCIMFFALMSLSVSAEHPATFVDLGDAENFTVLSKVAITSASA